MRRFVIVVVVFGMAVLPSAMRGTAAPGRPAVVPRERAEFSGPGVLLNPKSLPQAIRAVSRRHIPFLSEVDPARLAVLKQQRSYPGAPATVIVDRPVAARPGARPLAATLQRGFEGLSQLDNAATYRDTPPDTDIAAGPNHTVQVVKHQVRVSTKDGTTVLQAALEAWFANVAAGCAAGRCEAADPRVAYDPQEGRWVIVAITYWTITPPTSRLLVSISATSDPTGLWRNYNLDALMVYPATEETLIADFPDVGFDGIPSTSPTSGAIYLTANMFTLYPFGFFRTARLWILSKAQLYAGAALSYSTAWDRLNADGSQAITLRTAKMYGNPGVMYLANVKGSGGNFVSIWSVTPTYPPAAVIWNLLWTTTIGAYGDPPHAAQPGCAAPIQTHDNRLYNAVWRNNRIYGAFTEAAGVYSNIRYLRINTGTGVAERNLSYGAPGLSYFIPAVAVDSLDNVILVFGRSGTTEFMSTWHTGHLFAETTLQPSVLLKAGEQCLPAPFLQSVGDYSGAAVDPVGQRRIWIYGEWAAILPTITPDDQDWSTWVGRVQFGVVGTVGLYDSMGSTFFLRNSNAAGAADVTFGYGPPGAGWTPVAGDWNGDGMVTVGLYNPTGSTFFLRNSNTAGVADLTFTYGPAGAGWTPLAGDWNGDGVDTIGLYNAATSTFFLRNSNNAGAADLTFTYGPAGAGWTPLVGDWNGDGVDTIGLYNQATSTFYLRNSNTAGVADLTFTYGPAGAGWTPRVGDWNGDNMDTVGLYQPGSSLFFLRNSNAPGVADVVFGYGPPGAGWMPIAGDWDGL